MLEAPTDAADRSTAAPDALRSRIRRAMRADVAAVAMELFLERGFDATTVDAIATAAGISRSTFFRYFPTKEDTVLGDLADFGPQLLQALTERPATEEPWTTLRMALEVVINTTDEDHARAASRMFAGAPTLRARQYEKTLAYQALLVPEVARRLGLPGSLSDDPRPTALTACALACLEAAVASWTASNTDTSLSDLLDLAMGELRPQTPVAGLSG